MYDVPSKAFFLGGIFLGGFFFLRGIFPEDISSVHCICPNPTRIAQYCLCFRHFGDTVEK